MDSLAGTWLAKVSNLQHMALVKRKSSLSLDWVCDVGVDKSSSDLQLCFRISDCSWTSCYFVQTCWLVSLHMLRIATVRMNTAMTTMRLIERSTA